LVKLGLGPRPRWRETLYYRALQRMGIALQTLVPRLSPLLVHTKKSREIGTVSRG